MSDAGCLLMVVAVAGVALYGVRVGRRPAGARPGRPERLVRAALLVVCVVAVLVALGSCVGCGGPEPEFVASRQHYAARGDWCVTAKAGVCTYREPAQPERWEICVQRTGAHRCFDVDRSAYEAARPGYRYTNG
jgi:hypothetical protein